jgi:hypothetical protein
MRAEPGGYIGTQAACRSLNEIVGEWCPDAAKGDLAVPTCGERYVITGVAIAVLMGAAGCSSAGDKPVSSTEALAASAVPRSPVPTSITAPPLTAAEAQQLSTALTAQRSAEVLQAIAPEVREAYLEHPGPLLEAGSRMQISTTSFRALGTDLATADASVTGSRTQRYQLYLARRKGTWLILTTRKLK